VNAIPALDQFAVSFMGFFVMIDPIGAALIFNALVPASMAAGQRVKLALKATIISVVILIAFGLYGELILERIGISINALRISGGLLLFFTAFQMTTAVLDFGDMPEHTDISVYPMTIPLLAGPGSLTLSILLYSNAEGHAEQLSITAAVVAVMALSFILMCLAENVKRIIGRTGDEILQRFMGVLLAALAIQFIHDGVRGFL